MLLDVVKVQACPDYALILEFDNGEQRYFNMMPYMDQKPWTRLKSGNTFHAAFIDNGTVVWPGNIDIDPETLYERSIPVEENNNSQP